MSRVISSVFQLTSLLVITTGVIVSYLPVMAADATTGKTLASSTISGTASNTVSNVAPRQEPVLNQHFTPLILPAKAEQRGICLSGDAHLTEIGHNHYRMNCGIIFVDTQVPMQVDTCRGSIFAKAHSVFVIYKDKDAVRVFDFHDRARNSVRLMVGQKFVNLSPGVEGALIDKTFSQPESVVICSAVGYRRPQVLPVDSKQNLVVLEFSIVDKLRHGKIFAQLRESPLEQDHKLVGELEKTAAALATIYKKRDGRGGFLVRHRGWVIEQADGREEYAAFGGKGKPGQSQLAGQQTTTQ